MENENKNKTLSFLAYLDEANQKIEGWVEIVHFDASFVKFKTHGKNIIIIPTSRLLKIKEKAEE